MDHMDRAGEVEAAREMLGVGNFATQAEIRSNWQRRINQAQGAHPRSDRRIGELNAAFDLLRKGQPAAQPHGRVTSGPVTVSRPISKPLGQITHRRPELMDRVTSARRPSDPGPAPLRSREEDERISRLVRQVLNT